jgi:hypothetical protein
VNKISWKIKNNPARSCKSKDQKLFTVILTGFPFILPCGKIPSALSGLVTFSYLLPDE